MRVLLDTVVFIWAVSSPELISKNALAVLQNTDAIHELSVISLSEIAIKQAIGKLDLRKDDVVAGIADLKLRVLPYAANHVLKLFDLPFHHADPFDRQLIAQALAENIPIITCDEKFKLYKEINLIW